MAKNKQAGKDKKPRGEDGLSEAERHRFEAELAGEVEELTIDHEDQFLSALIFWHTANDERALALTGYRRHSELPKEQEPFKRRYVRVRVDMEWYEQDMTRVLLELAAEDRDSWLDRPFANTKGRAIVPEELKARLLDKVRKAERQMLDPDAELRKIAAESRE